MNMLDRQHRHSIRIVSRRTGLSPDVIRAWERRYGVVQPHRSETRRRLYSDADIERLRLLREVTRSGRRISDLAGLSRLELIALAREEMRERPGRERGPEVESRRAADFLADALRALERLDVAALRDCLRAASVDLGVIDLLQGVVTPFLMDVGERWHRGELRIYHEHLATASVRSLLEQLRAALGNDRQGPVAIATTPAGQQHELGALTAALIAAAEGWRTAYLGPDMPAEEIAAAARRYGASAVLLGLTYLQDPTASRKEIEAVLELLPSEVKLVVGGRDAERLRSLLEAAGGVVPGGLVELRAELNRLHQRLTERGGPVQ
jgi:DNA-binding transcriptional MerR regulator